MTFDLFCQVEFLDVVSRSSNLDIEVYAGSVYWIEVYTGSISHLCPTPAILLNYRILRVIYLTVT